MDADLDGMIKDEKEVNLEGMLIHCTDKAGSLYMVPIHDNS